MRLKLLHIIPSMNIGGREKVVLDLVEYLDKSKFDIEIACLGPKGTFYNKFKQLGVNMYFFNKHPGFDIRLFGHIRRFLTGGKYQVVHCHNPGALVYGAVGAMLAGVNTVINTEHGYGTAISRRKVLMETLLRNRITATVAVSNDLKSKLASLFQANPAKLITIHNGILCDAKQPAVDRAAFKKSFGFDPDDFVVGTVGRLEPVKDQKTLLEAFSILCDKEKKAKLVIVGDGRERRNLQEKADSLNLNKRIIFTGERNDVDHLLKGMDVFVLPSLSEGISVTLLEAMREGVPVIVTSVGGNLEVVEDNESGVLVPTGRPDIIAHKLHYLMINKNIADSISKSAMRRLKHKFNINNCASKYESLYINWSKHFE